MASVVEDSPEVYFREVLARAFDDRGTDLDEPDSLFVIEYISDVLRRFINKDRVFKPNELRARLDTITDMWMRTQEGEKVSVRFMGDFSLFTCGMFPEVVSDMNFYVTAGERCYGAMYREMHEAVRHQREIDELYLNLSRNFDDYRKTVNHARNKYMTVTRERGDPFGFMLNLRGN